MIGCALWLLLQTAWAQDPEAEEDTPNFVEEGDEEDELEIEGVEAFAKPVDNDAEEAEDAPEVIAPGNVDEEIDAPKEANDLAFKKMDVSSFNPDTRVSLSPQLGLAVPIGLLGPSLAPRFEVGIVPAAWKQRLRVYGQVAAHGGGYDGRSRDPRVGAFDYTVRQYAATLGVGVGLRVLGNAEAISPEITAAPQLHLLHTRVSSESKGDSLGTADESAIRLGWSGTVGFMIRTKELQRFFLVRVAVAGTRMGGVIIGNDLGLSVTPLVGYRMYQ